MKINLSNFTDIDSVSETGIARCATYYGTQILHEIKTCDLQRICKKSESLKLKFG